MNYSTFNNMNFIIKKDSTFPILKFNLTKFLMIRYGISDNMMESAVVTFSMIDAENGLYKIANAPGDLIINDINVSHDEIKYVLAYKFKEYQTSKSGRFKGEFKLDFLGNELGGKITLPNDGEINIMINDSITKTSII